MRRLTAGWESPRRRAARPKCSLLRHRDERAQVPGAGDRCASTHRSRFGKALAARRLGSGASCHAELHNCSPPTSCRCWDCWRSCSHRRRPNVASPFLLRAIVDEALPNHDNTQLTVLALGIAVASIAAGSLGVATTWRLNTIGQAIMHDLRTSLYEHVQRMSLAFFTRTRTGDLQSRIANDIGAIDNVVTSAAGTIVQSVTMIVAVLVALFALDWKLAFFSVAVVPLLGFFNRRVGRAQRKIAGRRQRQLADLTSLVEESLSVSGFLLARTMGRAGALADRFREESSGSATSRCAPA